MNATPPVSSHPAPDGGVSGLRPLNVIAAVANGGVPQARIRRVLADLAVPLAQLHAHRGVHGGIALSTIGLDASGKAHLMQPPLEPSADADNAARIEGYAAFEQYTDDPEWPCGPWTDVYALSAVAHTMLTGTAPPPALDRCVKDASVPLAGRELGAYDLAFLQAVDQGLSMSLSGRPQSIEAFVQAFGLGVALPVKEMPPPAAAEVPAAAVSAPPPTPPVSPIPVAAAAPPSTKAGPRVPLLVLLGVLAAIALVLYMWLRPGGPTVSSAGRDAPPAVAENVAPGSAAPAEPAEPEPPIPTPPALSDLGGSRNGSSTGEGTSASSDASATSEATAGVAAPTATAPEATAPQASAGVDAPAGAEAPAGSAAPQTTPDAANGIATAGAAASESSAGTSGAGAAGVPMTVNSSLSPGESSTTSGAAAGTAESPATPAGASTDPSSAGQAEATGTAIAVTGLEATNAAAQAAAAEKEQAKETPPPPAASSAVRVSVRPWGEVFIDGKSRGISPPLGEVKLSPGTHRVTIRNPASSDYHTTITVGRGGSGAISHVFE
ncbi:hypothetical protein [Bordetella tumulicola]|uniref:hypothetical protein n=1 Tax=Bordetella tumulicola TaxID=1649133 RepID=UPI0039EFD62C